jgi:hypothetical protein
LGDLGFSEGSLEALKGYVQRFGDRVKFAKGEFWRALTIEVNVDFRRLPALADPR